MAVTLRELLDAATPGPWFAGGDGEIVFVCTDDGNEEIVCWHEGANQTKPADARLIALAPELAALLLDMADALRADEETMSAVDWLAWHKTREALLARLDRISTQTERGSNNAAPVRPQDEGQGSEHGPTAIAAEPQEPRSVCVCDPGDCGEDCGTA